MSLVLPAYYGRIREDYLPVQLKALVYRCPIPPRPNYN